jgi:diguanylate cyclase (GGDEF)-like protein/PAS domain S-box-containing protein
VLVGVVSTAVVAIEPDLTAHLSWFAPAVDVATFVILSVVSVIGATDTWVRGDRRALPMSAGALVVGILWLADVPVSNDPQVSSALFALAQTGTPVILLVAFVMSTGGRLRHPSRAIGLVLSGAVAGGAALVIVTVRLAPLLPALSHAGRYSPFGQTAIAAGLLPLALALGLIAVGVRRGDRGGDPMIGTWVLLLFSSAATLDLHRVSAAGWMVVAGLRCGAFVLVTFGEMRLFAISARGERHRAEDLELLYEATSRIGSSLEPVAVARALVEIVEAVVAAPTGVRAHARVLQVDGSVVSVLARDGDVGGETGEVADSLSVADHAALRSAISTGEPAVQVVPIPGLVVPIVSGSNVSGAIEITSPAPGPSWQSAEIVTLIQGFAGLAALALANAEIFDDLQAAEAYNRAVLMAINDAFISITLDGIVVGWNEHATGLLGWRRTDVLGRDIIDALIPADRRADSRRWLSSVARGNEIINLRDPAEYLVLHANGATVPVEINIWRVDSGSSSRLCILVRDISARKAAEERLTRKATHDPLTELPNRELLLELLSEDIAAAGGGCEHIGVIFIDLDRFKTVNDTHGHDAGDRLLAAVATRLRRGVRPHDVVGRLSGDEFLVVCRNLSAANEVESVAERLRQVLAAPIGLDDTEVVVSASMGTAVGRRGSMTAKELIRLADQAMYRDKHSDRRECRLDADPSRLFSGLRVG